MFKAAQNSTRLLLSNQSDEQIFLVYYSSTDVFEKSKDGLTKAAFSSSADQVSVENIWSTLKGYFIFLPQPPSDLNALEESLQKAFPDALENNALAWVDYDDTNQQVQVKDIIAIQAGSQLKEGQILSHGAIQIHIKPGTVELKEKVDFDLQDGQTESLSNVVHLSQASTPLIETSQIQPLNNLYIPLSGKHLGTVLSDAVILGDLNGNSQALASLTYYFPDKNKPGNILRQDFPLGNIGSSGNSPVFQFSWHPLKPLDRTTTYLAFTDQNAKLRQEGDEAGIDITPVSAEAAAQTFFRTIYGEPIGLIPITGVQDGAKIVLQMSPGENGNENDFSLALSGAFEMALQAPPGATGLLGATGTHYLIGGLAGTEYISFQSRNGTQRGNAMVFRDGSAYAPNFPLIGAAGQTGPLLNDGPSNNLRTSWISVESPKYPISATGTTSPPPSIYFSQPAENSLFAINQSRSNINRNILDFFQTASSMLSGPTGGPVPSFPLVPYGGLNTAQIHEYLKQPETNHTIRDFEEQILGQARKNKIGINLPSTQKYQDVTTTASPKGLFVEVNNHSFQWARMQLAQSFNPASSPNKEEFLRFDNLKPNLQDSFQTNQQFLVISDNAELGKFTHDGPPPYGTHAFFENRMSIEGWTFNFNVPGPTGADGKVNNTVIFKYCAGTLEELVKNPITWTNKDKFNAPGKINELSGNLNAFVQNGIAAASRDPNFQQFKEIVTNPDWRGILVLNVDVDIQDFPPQLQGLLAGIQDMNRFKAHHFGIDLSQPSLINNYQQIGFPKGYTSSMFALINYVDPNYTQPNKPIDLHVSPNKPYNYAVLLLKVLFSNSKIQNFESKIQLSTDKLFSDNISKVTVNGANQTPDYKAILFDGSFEEYGGQPIYTFTAQQQNAQPEITKFYTKNAILNYVEVNNGNFSTLMGATGPSGSNVQAQFSLYGFLGFNKLNTTEVWDLYSFGADAAAADQTRKGLAVSNLNIDLSFQVNSRGSTGLNFEFRPQDLIVEESLTTYRKGSLYDTFPLKLSGFLYGDSGNDSNLPPAKGFPYFEMTSEPAMQPVKSAPDWYGIIFDLSLGTVGALASGAGLVAKFLLSWGAGKNDVNTRYGNTSLALPGAGISTDYFRIESVLEFTASQQTFLTTSDKKSYLMSLDKPSVKFLGKTFPNYKELKADFYISIFGDPSGKTKTLGWYGSLNPTTPIGNNLFKLIFLGIGHRVALAGDKVTTVEAAMKLMQTNFTVQTDKKDNKNKVPVPSTGPMHFAADSDWLVGAIFKIIDTFKLSGVFNDPNIYGLLISVEGDKAGVFKGLQFDVLYKKISDTVGVYHIELKLPEKYRKFDLGQVSITVPLFILDLYTDGSFKLLMGFPKSATDFSNSFTLQMIPFTGSGGFYFSYQKPGASTLTPQTTKGVFGPTVIIGIGLKVGVGKDISQGPIKAGASLTAIGFIEGIFSFFTPYSGVAGQNYYKLSGTVGISGLIYGSVNLVIVQAELKVSVSASVAFAFESYHAIALSFDVEVTVEIMVKVKVIFTVNINLSFKAKLHLDLTIGRDRLNEAPWYDGRNPALLHSGQASHLTHLPVVRLGAPQAVRLNWQPLRLGNNKRMAQLYFTPHLTVSGMGATFAQQANYVGMLYIDAPPLNTKGATFMPKTSYDNIAEISLAWAMNAYVNNGSTGTTLNDILNKTISLQELQSIYNTIDNSNEPPVPYDSTIEMLRNAFNMYIAGPNSLPANTEVNATVFPMLPLLTMKAGSSSASLTYNNDFNTFSRAGETYVNQVNKYFDQLYVDFQNEWEKKYNQGNKMTAFVMPEAGPEISMAQFTFQDYFQMIIQTGLDESIKLIQSYNYTTEWSTSLSSLAAAMNAYKTSPVAGSPIGPTGNNITPAMISSANIDVPLNPYATLLISGYQVPTADKESLGEVASRFGVAAADLGNANSAIRNLVKAGTTIRYKNWTPYQMTAQDDLATAVAALNRTRPQPEQPATVVAVINDEQNLAVLVNGKILQAHLLNIPNIAYNPRIEDSLQTIADRYLSTGAGGPLGPTGKANYDPVGSTLAVSNLGLANQSTPNVILAGTPIGPTGIPGGGSYSVQASDTLFDIAQKLKTDVPNVTLALKHQKVLNSQVALNIPYILENASVKKKQYTFNSLSETYNVPVPYLADYNQSVSGIFKTGEELIIPNLICMEVSKILDQLFSDVDRGSSAGMAARFFLQGLRLPITSDIKFQSGAPCTTEKVCAYYNVTGQQINANTGGPQMVKFLSLQKTQAVGATWLQFGVGPTGRDMNPNQLGVTLPDSEFVKAKALQAAVYAPGATYKNMKLSQEVPKHYTLKSHFGWSYPGTFVYMSATGGYGATFPPDLKNAQPSIWLLPDGLLDVIQERGKQSLQPMMATRQYPEKQSSSKRLNYYNWATYLNIRLKQVASTITSGGAVSNQTKLPNTYEVIGADETSVIYLERLLTYLKTNPHSAVAKASRAYVLYQPDGQGTSGLVSAVLGDGKTLIVQSNLSTYTQPDALLALAESEEPTGAEPKNLINSFKDFIELLWEASIIRQGGFYLYYQEEKSKNGLPDNLFTDNPIGEISLVLAYPLVNDEVGNYVNGLIVGDPTDPSASSVYIENKDLKESLAKITPGNVGFEVSRYVKPDAPPTDYQAYLADNYNLVGYQIVDNGSFNPSVEGLPAGPVSPDGAAYQYYEQVLPAAKFYKASPLQLNPLGATAGVAGPTGLNNPYLGVGANLTLQLDWIDLFGNKTKFTPASDGNPGKYIQMNKTVGYIDTLISATKLPSLTLGYMVSGNQLSLNFNFNSQFYQSTGQDNPKERALADNVVYQQYYYQLADIYYWTIQRPNSGAGLFLRNTLQPAQEIKLNGEKLYTYLIFITRITNYLNQISNGVTPPALDGNFKINVPISLNNPGTIFELVTELSLRRDKTLVDPEFKNNPDVSEIVSEITPSTNPPAGATGYSGMTEFARQFEANFKTAAMELKVAEGVDRFHLDGSDQNNKRVWAVRFGDKGIRYSINSQTASFYGPTPLANTLVSMNKVPIYPYKAGSGFYFGYGATYKSYSAVNIDQWAGNFLSAVDQLLSPEYVVPLSVISHNESDGIFSQYPCYKNAPTGTNNPYNVILNSKSCIAEAISTRLRTIVGPTFPAQSSLPEAQERFKQSILNQLSNAYNINAVVQNPVNVSYGPTGMASLFGQPLVTQPPVGTYREEILPIRQRLLLSEDGSNANATGTPDYSLSTSKIPVGAGKTSSYLTYLFSTQDSADHKNVALNLNYNLTHIEHQFGDIPGITGYRPSSWLSFIIPFQAGPPAGSSSNIGQVKIPIPLLEYPAPPSVKQQFFEAGPTGPKGYTGPFIGATGMTGEELKIQQAKIWSYNYEYNEVQAAQDSIQALIQYNSTGATGYIDGNTGAVVSKDLTNALAQFNEAYPSIQSDMNQYLARVTPNTPRTSAAYQSAYRVAQDFAWLAARVAQGWQSWQEVVQDNALKPTFPNSNVYKITETGASGSNNLLVTIQGNPANKNPNKIIEVSIPNSGGYYPVLQPESVVKEQKFIYKYQNAAQQYLGYSQRLEFPFRMIRSDNLEIIAMQNGWGGVSVVRNEYLLGETGPQTNLEFVFQTPLTRARNPLIPFLETGELINVAGIKLDPSQKHLIGVLMKNMFNAILLGVPSGHAQNIQISCNYSFNVNKDLNLEKVVLPVFLTVQFPLEQMGSAPVVANMSSIIENWVKERGLDKNTGEGAKEGLQHYNGHLHFEVTVFSDMEEKLPLFRLDNLDLNIVNVNW